ncbi:hypothetical protein RLEG12_08720 (plasmid) [Rhizobium leguminosarum bv. trifolii CB782]|nr:hypothetical protein RLEG12_08720 [Rhizobium leguminosarum bv. trifolii CB782]
MDLFGPSLRAEPSLMLGFALGDAITFPPYRNTHMAKMDKFVKFVKEFQLLAREAPNCIVESSVARYPDN